MKYWILSLLFAVNASHAQNLETYEKSFGPTTYDNAFEASSWEGMIDNFRDKSGKPLTWQEISAAPVEMGAAIVSIPLARKYLNNKIMNVWEGVLPVEVQSVKAAQNELKAYEKTVFNSIAEKYFDLQQEFLDAKNGYYTEHQVYTGTQNNIAQYRTDRTWHSPNPARARKILPELKAEKNRILPELNQRNAYARELDKSENILTRAQDEILIGAQKESTAASRVRASLRGYKVLKVVGVAASVFLIVDASIRSIVLLDGRHPGTLPIIPMSNITANAIQGLLNDRN